MHFAKKDKLILSTIICILILGILHNVFLPFAAVPDEPTHFAQAYALSNQLMGIQTDFSGGVIVLESGLRTDRELGLYRKDEDLKGFSLLSYFWTSYDEENYKIMLPDAGYPVAYNLVNTAYIPTAIGLTIARFLNFSWQFIYVFGRVFNLLFFVIIMYLAMVCCPDMKVVIAAIGLLPSVIWLAASYSYDGWNIAFSVLFVSLCIRISNQEGMVRVRDIFALLVIFILLVPIKYVYVFIALSVLLIPKEKWPKSMLVFMGIGAVGAGIILYVLRGQEIVNYLSSGSMDARGLSDESTYELSYTFSYVFEHPLKILMVFINTLVNNIDSYVIKSMSGEFYSLYVPGILTYITLIAFIIIMASGMNDNVYTNHSKSFRLMLGITVLTILTIFVALLFTFSQIDPIFVGKIAGVQGRYFIPVFICLPFIIHSSSLKNRLEHSILGRNYSQNLIYILVTISAVTFIFKGIGILIV